MKNQFASYEIASKLKELDFDEECIAWYYLPANATNKNDYILALDSETPENQIVYIKAPLWQQVIDWFREKHKIDIYPEPTYSLTEYSFKVITVQGKSKRQEYWGSMSKVYKSYEKARENAVLKAIELISK